MLAAPARANTQPFGGLTQFPGTRGCISEDGSAGRCVDGSGLAGVTAVTAAPAFNGETSLVYAVSRSRGTLAVLAVDPKAGGFQQTGCFSATPRAGCTTVPALAGATDVAAQEGELVAVAARDADAVVMFERRDRTLVPVPGPAGCAAQALPGCTPVTSFDEPVAVAFAGNRLLVAARASDAVSQFTVGDGVLSRDGCIQQGGAAPCAPGRALDSPEDLAPYGADDYGFAPPSHVAVASSGSGGVARLDRGDEGLTQPGGPAGCVTEGGAEGCTPGSGLAGASLVVLAGSELYVAAPGAGRMTRLGADTVAAPTAALATPPKPDRLFADGYTFAGSHLYAGGASIAPFARDPRSNALTGLAAPSLTPSGPVTGLAVSGDLDSLAAYAAVPSANALLAFARNIPPRCPGHGFVAPPAPTRVTTPAADLPLGCSDPNGDPLSYSVVTPPRLGRVIGFADGAALYRIPLATRVKGADSFTVRASDGGESDTRTVPIEVDYSTTPPPKAIARPRFRFLDRRVTMDRSGRIRLRVRCTVHGGSTCRVALVARRRGAARKSATLRSGRRTRIRIRLARPTRRAVRRARRKGVVVTVSATARDKGGRKATAKRRIRVRAKR